jgi:hypothetical protein
VASAEGIDEDDSFEHIQEHLDIRAAPRLFLLGGQQRIYRRTHRFEDVVQNVAMIFAEMMELSEKHSDDRQALIH